MSIATPNGSTPCFGRKSNPSPRMSEAIPGGAGAEMQSPRIELEQCVFDQGLQAPVRALQLQWEADGDANAERAWHMPDGVMLKGPAPRRFGITIIPVAERIHAARHSCRCGTDRNVCFTMASLPRVSLPSSIKCPDAEKETHLPRR